MRDKIVKTGHGKLYYRFVGGLRGLGFSLLALIALASPVAIVMGMTAVENAHAEETSHVVQSETSEATPILSSAE